MYTNKTPNLELPQWQLDDYLQPIADLNPAFAKLDTSITESNTKLNDALQKVQELTQQVTEDMTAIEQAKADIQKNAGDITNINQVLDGVKLKEAEVDAALKQIGLNVTKLFNNDLNIVRDLTALVDAETTRAKAQEKIIDTKATSAAVAAADAQNLAETSKSFAEEAKNSAAEAAQSASDSAAQATQAQETAESVKQDFETNVRPQVQEAKDAALAAQQSAEAANRQATLSAGYASNAARDAASMVDAANTATETANTAKSTADEALEKATAAETNSSSALEQATQAATSASTAETKATEAAESASTAEASATTAAADAESAKQDAASAKAEADAAKLSADAAAQSAASAEESAGTAATTSADAIQKAEAVETEFNQLKDTDWPAYKGGIDQSIEQLREEIPSAESLASDFIEKNPNEGQIIKNHTLSVESDADGLAKSAVELHPEGYVTLNSVEGSDVRIFSDGIYLNTEKDTLVPYKVGEPTDQAHAATKAYVDSQKNSFSLSYGGGTAGNNLSYRLVNLPEDSVDLFIAIVGTIIDTTNTALFIGYNNIVFNDTTVTDTIHAISFTGNVSRTDSASLSISINRTNKTLAIAAPSSIALTNGIVIYA